MAAAPRRARNKAHVLAPHVTDLSNEWTDDVRTGKGERRGDDAGGVVLRGIAGISLNEQRRGRRAHDRQGRGRLADWGLKGGAQSQFSMRAKLFASFYL